MKVCEKCGKEYEEELNQCPFCSAEESKSESGEQQSPEEVEEGEGLEKTFCIYCGNEITPGNTYCSKCGRSTIDVGKRHCTNCGTELEKGQKFCSKCGKKATNIVIPKNIDNLKNNRKKVISIASVVVIIVVLGLMAKFVFPKIFISSEEYLAQGNYEKAYDKAGKDDKKDVLIENLIAHICVDAKSNLKNINSFKLREAYFTDDSRVVLKIQGSNSYGGDVSSYWYYTFDEDDQEYQLWTTISDFEEEETHSWDDTSDKLEVLLKNATKETVQKIINDKKNKMSSDLVERINGLNKENKMDDVELLEQVKDIYPDSEKEE